MPPKTIAQRRIEVYLPSLMTRKEWVAAAKKRGTSLSEFVFEVVHTSLTGEGGDLRRTVSDLRHKVDALTAQLAEQSLLIDDLQAAKVRNERDLEEYRAALFLKEAPGKGDPRSKMDPKLVRVFVEAKDRSGAFRAVSEDELRKMFRVTPRDVARMRKLNLEVAVLEATGMVTKSSKGWTWNG